MSAAGAVRALRAHVETWRPYTLWYVGLVGLAGAALADGPHHPWLLLSAWAAPTAGWLGGHYLGDYFDRDLDAGSKPHRPIPSGRLAARTALWCGCACFAVLASLAVLGGWGTISAAVLAAFGIVAYSRWCKARGIAGNLVRGALGAMALLYGTLTVGLSPQRPSAVPVLLASMLAFWVHDTMSNLVGALRDMDGDRAGGYRTLPVRRGAPFAVRTVLALYAGTVTAALVAGLLADPDRRVGYLATLTVVVALGVAALAPLVAHRADMPVLVALRAHAVLVVERVVLASALVGLGLGVGPQLLLALPMVVLTWWAQRMMRAGHELGTGRPALALATPRRGAMEDVS
ncbi:UbiA family prenyltransferase [Micromonospora wenchangensis]|uniref:UbiA family prenyltransferase n=1 Tax=Micromonospora wenchangensis TaxID=1185415 RepID=UPI003D72C823